MDRLLKRLRRYTLTAPLVAAFRDEFWGGYYLAERDDSMRIYATTIVNRDRIFASKWEWKAWNVGYQKGRRDSRNRDIERARLRG